MPRIQAYLSDDLYEQVKQRGLPASELLQEAVRAGRGSAVDALVVASAEPGGVVLTGDLGDLRALAAHADQVTVERA